MNEKILMLLHELLCKAAEIDNAQELEKIISEYGSKLSEGGNETVEAVLNDVKNICGELISLRNGVVPDNRSKQLSALTEKEQEELKEVGRVIDENLFDYHFQPIVSAVDGEIYSYEALMRPKSSLCPSPYHIMKYAELTERLNDIERATFLNILGIIDDGKEKFSGRRVFINSIPKTKLSDDDNMRVNSLLEKHSDMVVVEMTEQSELDDNEFSKIKEQYKRMNIKIAVDDYGTGYSNVQNLIRYMPDYVKIDRSLLTEIQNSSKKRHFVREIVEFCHDNGILALAEGVETAEELRTVILLGVDLIQGYYTSRPNAQILETIPYEIKQEIKLYRQEREEGKKLRVYFADKSERVLLDRLVKEDYECVVVGKNGGGEVTIACTPGVYTKIHLSVSKGFKGSITLENVSLSNRKGNPCIDIGENCEVRLIAVGSNSLKSGGIRVHESSKLIVCGDGNLTIKVDGKGCYGIGNDLESRHGELVFEHGVMIENGAASGICIGSGLGGKISIIRGQFILNMTGAYGVGIGALYADTDLDLFACDITVDFSMTNGAAIGSLNGNCHAYIHSAAVKLYISGKNIVGIGTVSGEKCDVEISEANAIFDILAENCAAVAAIKGDTTFKLSRAGLHTTAEGTNALAFGGFNGNTSVKLVDSDSAVRLVNSEGHIDFISKQSVEVSGGRARFVVNDEEVNCGVRI